MTPSAMSMREVAARFNLSYDRFGKVWRGWVRDHGFPSPIRKATWDRAAVEAYVARRSAGETPSAPVPAPPAPDDRQAAAWRALEAAQRAAA